MSRPRRTLRWLGAAALAVVALGATAGPAAAHIQVRPAEAAPLDPTLWTVLVPNERNVDTTRVELKVPKGVVPFSFEEAPGWRRTTTLASDKSIDTIVWRGRLPEQGLASFTFLATTPDKEGQIAWKALQTYADGQTVRWIGPPDSEEPGSFTTVSKSTPRQNAGGEGGEQGGGASQTESEPAVAPVAAEGDDGSDTLPIVLAAAALVLSVTAMAVALLASRTRRSNGSA